MKVFMLCNGGSSHIEKWVTSLAAKNTEIGIFSLQHFDEKTYSQYPNITILNNPASGKTGFLSKLGYLKNLGNIKRQIKHYAPQIVHAHYATSYGLLAAKSKFNPLVISAWGSDVYDFPKNSALHKNLLKNVLAKANVICSTSKCMKEETAKYTSQKIEVIPFGVDTDIFAPQPTDLSKKQITIGIIKSLEKKYGIEYLVKAFHEAVKLNPTKELKLLVVGDGSKKNEYHKLCKDLGISEQVTFTGKVKHTEIINYHKQIDIFVSLSVLDSESFGVSLVEAMSCGKPVVASSVAGFKEVLGEDPCGLLVPRNTWKEPAMAITQYLQNPKLAEEMGKKARQRVLENYDWKKNLDQMLAIYTQLGNIR